MCNHLARGWCGGAPELKLELVWGQVCEVISSKLQVIYLTKNQFIQYMKRKEGMTTFEATAKWLRMEEDKNIIFETSRTTNEPTCPVELPKLVEYANEYRKIQEASEAEGLNGDGWEVALASIKEMFAKQGMADFADSLSMSCLKFGGAAASEGSDHTNKSSSKLSESVVRFNSFLCKIRDGKCDGGSDDEDDPTAGVTLTDCRVWIDKEVKALIVANKRKNSSSALLEELMGALGGQHQEVLSTKVAEQVKDKREHMLVLVNIQDNLPIWTVASLMDNFKEAVHEVDKARRVFIKGAHVFVLPLVFVLFLFPGNS